MFSHHGKKRHKQNWILSRILYLIVHYNLARKGLAKTNYMYVIFCERQQMCFCPLFPWQQAFGYTPNLFFGLLRHLIFQSWKHHWWNLFEIWNLKFPMGQIEGNFVGRRCACHSNFRANLEQSSETLLQFLWFFPETLFGRRFCVNKLQGESNVHQIVVTILCRLRPPFPQGELALFRYRKTPLLFLWDVLLFLQDLLYESTVSPTRT